MKQLPIIYIRGYAGPTAGIDSQVDDPFYGFNKGATHVRVDGDGDPTFYQFEGPMLRLITDEKLPAACARRPAAFLETAEDGRVPPAVDLWVYRFYDQAATTFVPQPHENVSSGSSRQLHHQVTTTGSTSRRPRPVSTT